MLTKIFKKTTSNILVLKENTTEDDSYFTHDGEVATLKAEADLLPYADNSDAFGTKRQPWAETHAQCVKVHGGKIEANPPYEVEHKPYLIVRDGKLYASNDGIAEYLVSTVDYSGFVRNNVSLFFGSSNTQQYLSTIEAYSRYSNMEHNINQPNPMPIWCWVSCWIRRDWVYSLEHI